MRYKILSYILSILVAFTRQMVRLTDRVDELLYKYEEKVPPFKDDSDETPFNYRMCGAKHPKYPEVKCIVMLGTDRNGVNFPHYNHGGYRGSLGRTEFIEWKNTDIS